MITGNTHKPLWSLKRTCVNLRGETRLVHSGYRMFISYSFINFFYSKSDCSNYHKRPQFNTHQIWLLSPHRCRPSCCFFDFTRCTPADNNHTITTFLSRFVVSIPSSWFYVISLYSEFVLNDRAQCHKRVQYDMGKRDTRDRSKKLQN